MKSQKSFSVFILLILSTFMLISAAYAGFPVRLEKEVSESDIGDNVSDVTFNIYNSKDADTAIASQTFTQGNWSAESIAKVFPERTTVRFSADFTNTDALTKDMELWVEIELDGVVHGAKEMIGQKVWALFSEESSFVDSGIQSAVNDEIRSRHIKEADGTTGQNTNAGSGIKTGHIQKGAVSTPKIKSAAITTQKIASGAVTTAKIRKSAVNSLKIMDGGVANVDIADNAVTSSKIADSSVTAAEIATGAVGTAEIANGAVTSAKIAGGSGSGVDADLLDGQHGNAYLRSNTSDGYTAGTLTFNSGTTLDVNGALRMDGSVNIADGKTINVDGNPANLQINGLKMILQLGNTDDKIGIGTPTPSERLEVAGNIELSGSVKYSSPKTYHLSLPGTAFIADNTVAYDWKHDQHGFVYINTFAPGTIGVGAFAPVSLPEGATVTGLHVYVYDNNRNYNLATSLGYLYRRGNQSVSRTTMTSATFATSGFSHTVQIKNGGVVTNPVIANDSYTYYLYVSWWIPVNASGIDIRFYGMEIDYTISTINP